jgi:hypothetical protein
LGQQHAAPLTPGAAARASTTAAARLATLIDTQAA